MLIFTPLKDDCWLKMRKKSLFNNLTLNTCAIEKIKNSIFKIQIKLNRMEVNFIKLKIKITI